MGGIEHSLVLLNFTNYVKNSPNLCPKYASKQMNDWEFPYSIRIHYELVNMATKTEGV